MTSVFRRDGSQDEHTALQGLLEPSRPQRPRVRRCHCTAVKSEKRAPVVGDSPDPSCTVPARVESLAAGGAPRLLRPAQLAAPGTLYPVIHRGGGSGGRAWWMLWTGHVSVPRRSRSRRSCRDRIPPLAGNDPRDARGPRVGGGRAQHADGKDISGGGTGPHARGPGAPHRRQGQAARGPLRGVQGHRRAGGEAVAARLGRGAQRVPVRSPTGRRAPAAAALRTAGWTSDVVPGELAVHATTWRLARDRGGTPARRSRSHEPGHGRVDPARQRGDRMAPLRWGMRDSHGRGPRGSTADSRDPMRCCITWRILP